MLKMTDFVLKYSTTKGDIMINEEKQVCYNMQVYNDFVDFPIAMTNIEEFEFDKLLSHPNPEVRAFNFIVITKCTTKGNTTTVRPLMIIYNKKDWKVESYDIEDYYGSRTKTLCSNRKQTLDFAEKLIELPCNNQNAIINKFNITSKILIAKNKIKGKSLIRKK